MKGIYFLNPPLSTFEIQNGNRLLWSENIAGIFDQTLHFQIHSVEHLIKSMLNVSIFFKAVSNMVIHQEWEKSRFVSLKHLFEAWKQSHLSVIGGGKKI